MLFGIVSTGVVWDNKVEREVASIRIEFLDLVPYFESNWLQQL